MLFMATYKPRGDWSEATGKRSLQLFTSWKPPAGFEFKSHYASPTGGGFFLAEVNSPAAALEAMSPFGSFFDFEITPVVDMMEAVPIIQRTNAWRDSVK
jgi:hypothetical protein